MRVFLSVKKVTKTNAFLKSFKKRTKEILLKILLLSIIGTPTVHIHEKRTKLPTTIWREKNLGRIFDLHAKGNWRIFDCYSSE